MIRFTNVSKRFKNQPNNIFENLSFNFEPKLVYVLRGANGSGKTTLIKLISSLLKVNSGSIEVPEKCKISYVSSNERSFFGRMTGHQNLEFFSKLDNGSNKKLDEFIAEYNEAFRFNEFLNKKFIHMSSGQKKKMAIARAFSKKSSILLLDEPFNFLDESSRQALNMLIKNSVKSGKYVILATNNHEFHSHDFVRNIVIRRKKIENN